MAESVHSIHEALRFAEHEPHLRAQEAVWRTLQALKAKAEKQPALLGQYKSLLAGVIDRLQVTRTDVLTEDDLLAFWPWTEEVKREAGISAVEARRGSCFELWSEKWLREPWDAYVKAFGELVESPSRLNLERTQKAFRVLVNAYLTVQ